MRLGLLTAPFPETPLADVVDWTAANGFESVEIACWPRSTGPTRRYAGTSHIDVVNLSADAAKDLRAEIEAAGLHISGLGYYPNPLHPDRAHREQVIGHLRHVITAAEAMDVPFVNTFMGADGAKNPALMEAAGRAAAALPGGHVEGFGDTFAAHFRAVYADIAAGRPSERPAYPTFADGHDEMLVNDAIAESARLGRWVDVVRDPVPVGATTGETV